jgi:membrane-bound lytic murein transglycosylase D
VPGLTSLLLLLSSAHAANGQRNLWTIVRADRARHETKAAEDEPATAPVVEEGATNRAEAIIEATTPDAPVGDPDLEAEHAAEHSFLEKTAGKDPSIAFYDDPISALDPDPLHLDQIDPREFDIPIVVNDEVVKWMQYFTGKGSRWYRKWLARSTAYQALMADGLDAGGLPLDIRYLSMIESGYSTDAYSSAAAVGLWQFISTTGRENGLRIDSYVDERRDPWSSTEAAVKFLTRLHKLYGDWYLAFAAYNAGPGKINRAIERTGSKDFWVLAKSGTIRDETANYVPKLLAAAIIGKHPERYGFGDVVYQPRLELDTVTVDDSYDLEVLAKCAGLSTEAFLSMNPHLRQGATPAGAVDVHVPVAKGEGFLVAAAAIPDSERIRVLTHRVKSGETLGQIARRYGTTVSTLQAVNHIKNVNTLRVGTTLTIPKSATAGVQLAALEQKPVSKAVAAKPVTAKPSAPKPKPASAHVVASGETLSDIADRYDVAMEDLVAWNAIADANAIHPGQSLVVSKSVVPRSAPPVNAVTWSSYTVRRGDTLTAIAQRQGCSVEELRSWNGLRKSTIYAGQKLKVKKA